MQDSLLTLMLQSVAGLAVVLAIFALLIWMLKRLQQQRYAGAPSGSMRIVQRFGIDAKHSVVELAHNGRSYLLGISPEGMTTIASHQDDAEAHTPPAVNTSSNPAGDSA
ncbi:MAG: flagellar biosynthetic protein FliO [Mariprofundaceae bacterium]|nr:flagellar biosynthetic protein FliO [Mariprofundaceae bacterium]